MSHWQHFQDNFLRDTTTGLSLDVSRMGFDPNFFDRMAPLCTKALAEMAALEAGADDVESSEDGHEIWVGIENLHDVARALEPALGDSGQAKLAWKPGTMVTVGADVYPTP